MELYNQYQEQINLILKQQKAIKYAYLFGSYARNTQKDTSDIDILIDIDKNIPFSLIDLLQLKFDLEDSTVHKVDLLTTEGVSKYIMPFIEKDKKLIYER